MVLFKYPLKICIFFTLWKVDKTHTYIHIPNIFRGPLGKTFWDSPKPAKTSCAFEATDCFVILFFERLSFDTHIYK